MKISVSDLKACCSTILTRSGYPAEEVETILDVLLYAQLRGNNQGVVKLIGAGLPRDTKCEAIRTLKDTKVSALLDGQRNTGMIVMKRALELALEKARAHGIGLVGTHNTASSTGAIGYYANQAAKAGYIALIFSGSGEYVAMDGSYEPLMGTNPLAIGIPTEGEPIVFDMATAAIARYGVVEAKTAGRTIPPDVAYDNNGQPTTDPSAALAGAIRTFGGYKGAALALMVEILTGPLVGTSRDENGHKMDWGNLVLVIDPELLIEREEFQANVTALVQRLKAARKLARTDEILVPGERGNRILAEINRTGLVEIEDKLWEALQQTAS